ELEFAARQPDPPAGIAEQLAELEARLGATIASRERLSAVEQKAADIAGPRGAALDQVVAAYDQLERGVDELLPAHSGEPALEPLIERLAVVKRRRPPAPGDR